MNRKDKNALKKHSGYSPKILVFFISVAAIIISSAVFIITVLKSGNYSFLKTASGIFSAILISSLVYALADSVKERIISVKSTKRILEATNKIKNGDLTARINPVHKKSKNEYDLIIENFNIMADELSGIEPLRNDFISNVSHEFKTPLSIINSYAEILKSENITDTERIEYASEISKASYRLSELTSDILRLNKLDSRKIKPTKVSFNLSEKICECILLYEPLWEEKNICIECDIEENIFIESDAELLSLVWNNLISNAVKFTQNSGAIYITAFSDSEKITVKIKDTGCGMSNETMARIFEKFYQGDISHSEQGNGLGLALVKKVLNVLEGDIIVESELGSGSIFTVILYK